MGAWGYGPLDNDDALDWKGDLKAPKTLAKDIDKGLNGRGSDPNTIRAAAEMILQVYGSEIFELDKFKPLIGKAIQKLNKLLEDDEWISEWYKPASIRRSIKSQIKRLEAIE